MKAIPPGFLAGGAGLVPGHGVRTASGNFITLEDILTSLSTGVADATAAQALGPDDRSGILRIGAIPYWWDSTSLANDATSQLSIRPTDITTILPGRWLPLVRSMLISMAVASTTANSAVLFTVPVGFRILLGRGFYDNSVAWTGGTNAATGASSSNAAYNTAGDLQGGASGDLTAAMGAGIKAGTVGAKFASNGIVVLIAGDTIIHNRIADNYAAGTGRLYFPVTIL